MAKEHEEDNISNVSGEDMDAVDADSDHEPNGTSADQAMDSNEKISQDENALNEEPNADDATMMDENGVPKRSIISKVDYVKTINNDNTNRLEYLLKQTEIFSHFMTFGKDQPQKPKVGRKPKPKEVPIDINDHRHRRTEEEEDAELLNESKKDVNLFRYIHFSIWFSF